MKTPLCALLLALSMPLVATAADASEKDKEKKITTVEVRLEPGKVHEECMKLDKDQSKRFEWTSDTAVDFNIHYHKGPDAFYPFKANNRKEAKARFEAPHADSYCWMWEARRQPATIKGKIQ